MPKDLLTAAWKLLLLRGVIGIVLGIVLIAWPQATIVVLMVLIGIWALIDGIGLAAQVFAKGASTGQRVFFGVMALVALVVALFAIFRPGTGRERDHLGGRHLAARAWSVRAGRRLLLHRQRTPRWLLVLGALLDLVLGWLFVTNPGKAPWRGGRHRHPRRRLGHRLRRARPRGPQRHQGPAPTASSSLPPATPRPPPA